MRTLASFIVTSLDGFYEGPNAEFDWPIVDEEFKDFAVRQLDDADTLGFGRATYDHMAAYWPTDQAQAGDPDIASRMNAKPKLVFSTVLEHASWSGTTIVGGDAVERMDGVKSAPGGELLVVGSAHLTACLAGGGRPRRAADHGLPGRPWSGPFPLRESEGEGRAPADPREEVRLWQCPAHLPDIAPVPLRTVVRKVDDGRGGTHLRAGDAGMAWRANAGGHPR